MEYILSKIFMHVYIIWANQGDVSVSTNIHHFFMVKAFKILSPKFVQHTVCCCYL